MVRWMENQASTKRFLSLKLKWALGTAVGSLLISILLIVIIFSSFTQDLMRQERQTLSTTMTSVSEQINNHLDSLSTQQINQEISSEVGTSNKAIFSRDIVRGLSNSQIEMVIYNRQGKAIYQLGKAQASFKKSSQRSIVLTKGKSHQILVGRMPITSRNHRVIGYLQIENNLNTYHQRYQRQLLVVIIALLLVVILSGLLGYFLSWFFLRPLNDIGDTVKAISDDPTKDVRVPELRQNDELSELSTMFNQMLDRTQRYIDQQSQFVGDVSHELRTPVAIIQGHMQLLDRWGKDDPQVLEDSIQASLKETERMNNLVQEMLDLSRAEQVELNFRDATSPVKEVVMQVYNNFKMIHPDYTFVMDDDLQGEVISPIYHDHLEQIMIILCDNAVKYSTNRQEVDFSLSRSANFVEIGIQDYGEGIADEDIDKVFDRFYRVDKARSRKKGGNGLGLAIAKRLIEGYHGMITLESTLGSGSVFTVKLPIVEEKNESTK